MTSLMAGKSKVKGARGAQRSCNDVSWVIIIWHYECRLDCVAVKLKVMDGENLGQNECELLMDISKKAGLGVGSRNDSYGLSDADGIFWVRSDVESKTFFWIGRTQR